MVQAKHRAGGAPLRRAPGSTRKRKAGPVTIPFRELLASLPEERRRRIDARTEELLADLALQELRQARSLSQEELGRVLEINQASVSKLERRTDMYISTLRRVVEAMGGELEITARFPEGRIRIKQFGDL